MPGQDFIKVSLLDAIRVAGLARQNNEDEEVVHKLTALFVDADATEVNLLTDSTEAICIAKYKKEIPLKSCITLESLGLALNRLYVGKNDKELLKRVEKYYRTYIENIKNEEDNTRLKEEILADQEVFELLSQYPTYASYEGKLMNRPSKTKVKGRIEQKVMIQGKAIVE